MSSSTATATTLVSESEETTPALKSHSSYQELASLSDIQTLRDLNKESIRDILRHYTKDHTLTIREMGQLEDMSGLNDAFNSTICSLKVVVNRRDDVREEFNFVIKSPPKTSFIRMVHKLTQPFFNEVSWYLDLIGQLELANGSGCIDDILPKCYYAFSSYYANKINESPSCCVSNCPWFCWLPFKKAEDGILILENIKCRPGSSYSMYDKKKPLPLDHMNLIMKSLAHFHGKWLKWKFLAQSGKLDATKAMSWTSFRETFNTQRRIPDSLYKRLERVAKKVVIKILKSKGEEENENVEKCRRFFDHTALQCLKDYMKISDSPVHTLCHGDFWSNNILFSYDDDQKVRDLNIIDYQLLNYGHPCYDLVYLIYLNTDLEFRDAHLKDVLKIYYSTFHPYLAENCPDEEFRYSFEDFMTDFNWHKSIGFTTACSVMPNVMSSSAMDLESAGVMAFREIQRKQERELEDETNPSTKEIRRRIIEMVHEMARDGVI